MGGCGISTETGEEQIVDSLSKLFAELLSGDDGLAETAAARIAAVGERALPELERMLEEGDEEVRWWAVRTLAAFESADARGLVQRRLRDQSSAVRQCAALAFIHCPDLQAAPDLVRLLEEDDGLTRRLAAEALAALGCEGVSILLEILETGSTRARIEAARGLARIGDQRAVGPLFQLLDDESAPLTYWAEEGLKRMGIGMVFFKPGSRG